MAKMTITEILDNKYLTDSSLAQQLVAGTLSLDDQIIKDHIHQVAAYELIYDSGEILLNNNQIRYTADRQLTIKDDVDYTEHTFEDGIGMVTFNDDLTILGTSWFGSTFDDYYDNITSLTLPNGVLSIGISALSGAGDVYYEGTQKECARIDKDWADGTGVDLFICSDGSVNGSYTSNRINPWFLNFASWLGEIIEHKTLQNLMTAISSARITEYPMTAGEFISILVNGMDGGPGLSQWEFTVVNQEFEGVTVPLAYHAKSKHFIGIAKATDYEHTDGRHLAPVAVDESLDPDLMYILLDDTIIFSDDSTYVDVTVEHEDGTSTSVSLDANKTYGEQGYAGWYSQNTYDSSVEGQLELLLVDNNRPAAGETIYSYCNDIYEPEQLPSFYETVSTDFSSKKIDENVPDSIPFLVVCLGFVDGWFDTIYGKSLEKDGVIDWYTKSPIDLGQIYDMGKTLGEQHANEPRFRDPYFAVGYIDGYLDYLESGDHYHYLKIELKLDDKMSSEIPGYDEGAFQGRNDHYMNAH